MLGKSIFQIPHKKLWKNLPCGMIIKNTVLVLAFYVQSLKSQFRETKCWKDIIEANIKMKKLIFINENTIKFTNY